MKWRFVDSDTTFCSWNAVTFVMVLKNVTFCSWVHKWRMVSIHERTWIQIHQHPGKLRISDIHLFKYTLECTSRNGWSKEWRSHHVSHRNVYIGSVKPRLAQICLERTLDRFFDELRWRTTQFHRFFLLRITCFVIWLYSIKIHHYTPEIHAPLPMRRWTWMRLYSSFS